MMKFILYLSEMNINEWYLWLLLLLLMLFFFVLLCHPFFLLLLFLSNICILLSPVLCWPINSTRNSSHSKIFVSLFTVFRIFCFFSLLFGKKFHTLCHILLNIPQHQIWPTISYWIAMTFVAFYFLYNFSPVSGIFSVFFSIFYIPCV